MFPSEACQVNRERSSDPSDPQSQANVEGSNDPLTLTPPLSTTPSPAKLDGPLVDLVRASDGRTVSIAKVVEPECSDDMTAPFTLQIRVEMNSSIGPHVVDMKVKGRKRIPLSDPLATDSVQVEVEGYRMSFPTSGSLASEIRNKACAERKGDSRQINFSDSGREQLALWLEQVAPDCEQITFGALGWTCHLPSVDPDLARQELAGIQTTMISRWSRQPYLLARRLAIGLTLAQALKESPESNSLGVFCRIIQNALPIELPLTLASRRWQMAVCSKEPRHQRAAALFGLSKTVSEIDFMRQLFERTSRLGYLTLRIPASQVPGKQILVSLTPEVDVADNLTYETARLWASEGNESGEIDSTPKSCWHPVYGEHPRLFNLARQLGMTGDAQHLACDDIRDYRGPSPFPSSERYFAESVTSETEFIVQNGRSKTLRLPSGKYSYTLRVLPDDPEIWDDVSQQSSTASGQINWDERRPRPVISTWQ